MAIHSAELQPSLGERQNENYRSWIRKNSGLTEFLRIQLRIVVELSRLSPLPDHLTAK